MADNSSNSNGSSILPSVLLGAGTIVVFAVIVLLGSLIGGGDKTIVVEPDDSKPTAAVLREQEAETLTTYGWVDQEKGTVRIPVERAEALYLEELNQ